MSSPTSTTLLSATVHSHSESEINAHTSSTDRSDRGRENVVNPSASEPVFTVTAANDGSGDAEAAAAAANTGAADAEEADTTTTESRCCSCGPVHRHNCCLKTKQFLESSAFSFTLGVIFLVLGICLIGASPELKNNSYFLIGPFMLAAGTILLIRGCINELAKRQQVREEEARAERERSRAGRLTTEERRERNERLALSEENIVIPPPYEEAVKPRTNVQVAEVASQVNFLSQRLDGARACGTATQDSIFTSIQSQTELPSMYDMCVDTSDLPQDPDSISQAPPSYNQALSPHTSSSEMRDNESAATVTVYLPTEED